MSNTRTKYEFYQEASLSQKLAHKMPEYKEYAGSDPAISGRLAKIKILIKYGLMDAKDPNVAFLIDILHERRKAAFATSEKVNEISKMGMQMPKAEGGWSADDDDESEEENP